MGKFAIIFFLTFGSGIIATLAVDASWGIYLWIIEYFFNPRIRWWYDQLPELRYSFLIILSILISYALRWKQYSHNRLGALPQAKWIAALVIMCGFINLWAVWPAMHWKYFTAFFKLIVIIAIIYKVIDTPVKFERMTWAYMLGAFYIGWIAFSGGRTAGGRLSGIGFTDGMDDNAVAAAIASVIPLVIYYVFYETKIVLRGIAVIFLAFMLNTLILANSRGAFLGLTVSMIYYFLRTFYSPVPTKDKKKYQFMLVGFCAVGLFFYLTDAAFWERMATLGEAAEQASNKTGRTYFWLKAIDLVQDHPWGVGIWGYQYLSPGFIPPDLLTTGQYGAMRAVHSTLFQSLVEYGYLGIVLLGGMVVSTFLFMWRVQKYLLAESLNKLYLKSISIESTFIAFLIPALFLDRLYAQSLYVNMVLIACFGNIYFLQKNNAVSNSSSKKN
ncbi:MAG: O-antigen ligase family protein [Thermodesulfobacteriota bacterium]|nr:O-antigen ligase family protein [Thermodesulfobacteriota bacterium]